MASTIRELIIQDIHEKLEDIREKNGYATDIGQNALRSVLKIPESELPSVVVFPGAETNEPLSGKNKCTFTIKVDALSKFDTEEVDYSEIQEKMLGDMIWCLTNPYEVVFKQAEVDSIRYAGGGSDTYPEDGESTTTCPATFEVQYKYLIGNPYQQE